MGMTIENCKKRLVIEKELAIKTGLNHDANGTLADAIDFAVETMCKYQKIEQILKDIPYGGETTVRRIQEVIEDGSN